ncbi:SMI1/KNR4 family protein [Nocardia otitidiscaviarum]|uniref:SMI1/KNR4 family protein n=1 Tax=Nocardia otitidiscaviarum TaxID=1823 RepID=UPI0018934D84|nr:SMI1/KNR4 family protein [Nocardia otitidiscaviarum]MBF6183354.1 SMI1/KNR4 family protein [Nocardia otitidiscaviarum]
MRFFRTTVILVAAVAACAACSKPATDDSGDWCAEVMAEVISEQKRWYNYEKSHGGEDEDLTWMLTTPNPPATTEEISTAEQRLDKRLDKQLRQWLEHVNGWHYVWGTTSLYSTQQMVDDADDRAELMDMLNEVDRNESEFGVGSLDDLIVIGTNADQSRFVLTTGCDGDDCGSAPVWSFDGETETYTSLRDYLTTMVEQLKTMKRD